MNILTENQARILRLVSQVPLLRDNFFLTGGTALSEFYLQHRYSDDLDLFTSNDRVISNAVSLFIRDLSNERIEYKEVRRFDTFAELHLNLPGEVIKMDFALESHYRLKPTKVSDEFGIAFDNELDISCNKLSALFDRADPKDFVDIYFVNSQLIAMDELIESTKKKHVGLDNYWLARAFFKVNELAFLPRMIKPVNLDDIKSFFLSAAEKLITST